MQHKLIYLIIINNNEIILNKNNMLPSDIDIMSLTPYFLRKFPLGNYHNIAYYCAEVDNNICLPNTLHKIPLRKVLSMFNDYLYNACVKAYSVIHWDKNHQFCGGCGAVTIPQHKGFERICSSCKLSFFPRISPSIIVLIKKDDHLVMARSPHFAPGIYGLIAGFVEIGESLEDAVHREVKEEVGLEIKNLTYFGSQPWPFPDSLMAAFMADHASGEILIDNDEIADAGWYKYDNLPGRPSAAISIASKLLDNFIHSCKQQPTHHSA